jgi:hypothetical protein
VVTTAGCRRHEADDFWILAKSYRLVLHLSERPPLTAEQASSLAPVADSAVFVLRPDSVRLDRAAGTYRGDARHFPVPVASSGGSAFVAMRKDKHWETMLGGAAADSGIQLSGVRSGNMVRGTWRIRSSDAAHGDFTITPGR